MWKSKFHNFFLGVQNNPNSFLNLRHLYWNILIISLSDKFTGFENEWTFEKSDSNHLQIFIIFFNFQWWLDSIWMFRTGAITCMGMAIRDLCPQATGTFQQHGQCLFQSRRHSDGHRWPGWQGQCKIDSRKNARENHLKSIK